MNDGRIRTAAVVGQGVAAWSAAAALRKRVPGLAVALVPVTEFRPGFVDLTGTAAPSIGDFHRDIGLSERDVVARTGAGYRLGTRFTGWSGDGSHYFHAYGPAGQPIEQVPFAPLWVRDGDAAFDAFSPGAVLASAGRFVPAGGAMPGGYAHGLLLDPRTYARFIEAYARHCGVVVTAAPLAAAILGDGQIDQLRLRDGSQLTADLYVDATNAAGALIGRLENGWEDWSRWLPADQATWERPAPGDDLPPFDTSAALPDGWRATAATPVRRETLLVRAGATAAATEGSTVAFRSGRRPRAWIGNMVAIGEAHTVIEPIEGAPLHLLHTQIDRLVGTLPDRSFAAIELAHYNRLVGEEADRLRDFAILHYVTADRPEPFWRAVRAAAPPAPLADTLALFRERGRLPVRDGESFDRDSWHAVLLGQGVRPRRIDVLAGAVDPARARAAMTMFRHRLAAAAKAAPRHRDYLAAMKAIA